MTYEQFMLDLWREMKRMAVEPVLSLGDLIVFLAVLAYKPPNWVAGLLMGAWIIWKARRDSDTRPKDGDAKLGSTRE